MFVLRSLFWLSTLVILLPPAASGEPSPRISVLHAALAARVLMQDVTGVCERNPHACATSREALTLLARKVETGASIVSAGIAATQGGSLQAIDHGSLRPDDLQPEWALADASP